MAKRSAVNIKVFKKKDWTPYLVGLQRRNDTLNLDSETLVQNMVDTWHSLPKPEREAQYHEMLASVLKYQSLSIEESNALSLQEECDKGALFSLIQTITAYDWYHNRSIQDNDGKADYFLQMKNVALDALKHTTATAYSLRRRLVEAMPYQEYLKTPEWEDKRLRKLLQANYRCQKCLRTFAAVSLHVHHDTYAHLGDEWDTDLRVLCVRCHRCEHDRLEKRGDVDHRQCRDAHSEDHNNGT